MDDVQAVQVFDGTGQVVQHPTGISLCVFASGSDGIEKVSALEESSWLSRVLTDGPIGCPRRGLTNQKGDEERTRMWGVPKGFLGFCFEKDSLVTSFPGMGDSDILS